MNKHLAKCYSYFGFLLLLCVLAAFNYFATRNRDGFRRLGSLNLDLQKFYCFREIYDYEQCENLLGGELGTASSIKETEVCEKYKAKMEKCKTGVKDHERDIQDHCWMKLYDVYVCSEDKVGKVGGRLLE